MNIKVLKETGGLFILSLHIIKLILLFTFEINIYYVWNDMITIIPILILSFIRPKIIYYCTKLNKKYSIYSFLLLNIVLTLIADCWIMYYVDIRLRNSSILYKLYYVLKMIVELVSIFIISMIMEKRKSRNCQIIINNNIIAQNDEIINITYIKSININEIDEENKQCSICLEEYDEKSNLNRLMRCKHVFHETCINKWIKTNETCPLCRANVIF